MPSADSEVRSFVVGQPADRGRRSGHPTEVLRPGWVEVAGDRVVAVGSGGPDRPADAAYPDGTMLPGFVDIHLHGGGGASFTTGDQEEAARAVAFHRSHGTTTMLASLVSTAPKELLRQVSVLTELVQDGLLAGIHLEGPWLARGKRGAHDPSALRDPDPAEISRLLDVGRGTIRMVALAPERPGGLDAVRYLATEGVTVAVGHTEADYQLTRRAIEADAMSAAGMSDGQYTLGTLDVVVTDGTARLPSGSIAGSTATTADLFAAAYEALRGRSEALLGATQVSASTPAAALGLDMVGMLSPGHRADLVVLGGGGTPAGAMAAGHWVHAPHRRAPLVRSGAEPARARHRRSSARPHSP